MRPTLATLAALITLALWSCDATPKNPGATTAAQTTPSAAPALTPLAKARATHKVNLTRTRRTGAPAPTPPEGTFNLTRFDSPLGPMSAYVGVDPGDGKRHPAIVWLVGGFSNSISPLAWAPSQPENQQSARAFRDAGVIMMYPSRRGGNDSPGHYEAFFGEVDDVLAATDLLATLPYVDPDRIYLGGHSTGGLLALLIAATTSRYRGVLAIGPVAQVSDYKHPAPFDLNDTEAVRLRSPIHWLDDLRTPTLIVEGAGGYADAIRLMQARTDNPQVRLGLVAGHDHFTVIDPVTRAAAQQVLRGDDLRPLLDALATPQ